MPAQTFRFLNHVEGLYSDVSPLLVPENALYAMSNVVTSYKLGSILKRPGYEKIGATLQANKAITGLHNFRQSATTQKMLATVNDSTDDDTQLFYKTAAGAWTEITAAETAWANKANINVEFEDFIGYNFMVGWGATDGFIRPSTLTDTTFGTTNAVSMPNAKFIKRFRDRIYIANTDISGTATPYRVYFSSVPVAGAITWTVASDFLDVDFSEEITGLEQNWDRLMVFTEYSAYLYTQDLWKKTWDIGCSNQRTLKNSGTYMMWANRDGVWMSSGGFPVNVAGRVIDFIRYGDMRNSFAEVVDEEYYLYVGNVTVNGISYANTTLVFNIPSQTWRVEEYFDDINVFASYAANGQTYLYMGASDGDVHRRGKYTDATLLKSDNGSPIQTYFQTGALHFGAPEIMKEMMKIIAFSERAQQLSLKARIIDVNTQVKSEFKPLGKMVKYINEFSCNPKSGHLLQIEGTENSTLDYWSLFGFCVNVEADVLFKN